MKKTILAAAVLLAMGQVGAVEMPSVPDAFDFTLEQTNNANQNANAQLENGVWSGIGAVKPMASNNGAGSPFFIYANADGQHYKNEGTIWVLAGNLGEDGSFGRYATGMVGNGGIVENQGNIYVKASTGGSRESAKGMSSDGNGTIINGKNGTITVDGGTAMALTTKANGQVIKNEGTINVVKGYGIAININDTTGDAKSVTVANSGTMNLGASTIGIMLNNSFDQGTFTNSGRIAGEGTAIFSYAASAKLVNEAGATIETNSAMSVYSYGEGTTITNNGTIRNTKDTGIALNVSGSGQHVVNAGTIDAAGTAIKAGKDMTLTLTGNSHVVGGLNLQDDSTVVIDSLASADEALNFVNEEIKALTVTDSVVALSGEGALRARSLTVTGDATTIKLTQSRALSVGSATGDLVIESDHLATDGPLVNIDDASGDVNVTFDSSVTDNINAADAEQIVKDQIAVTGEGESTTVFEEGLVNGEITVTEEGSTVKANSVQLATLDMMSNLPVAMTRMLANDVRKRMGDLRASTGTHGAWARVDGAKLSGESGLDADFQTVQVGIDTIPTPGAARLGVAFSYTNGNSDFARGEADTDAFSLAAYGTWFAENGLFVDVIGRMSSFKHDLAVKNGPEVIDAESDNLALSLSGELGWHLPVTNLFYVEPQVEVMLTFIDGDSFKVNAANYVTDATTSLIGRAGLAAGFKCPNDKGDLYVRASAVHEFDGDASVTVNDLVTTSVDGKDTWIEYGFGANFNLTDATYVWADVERTSGGVLDEDYRATIGVRHSF